MLWLVNVSSTTDTLREIFQKNGYLENFIDRCFKLFSSRIHTLKKRFIQSKRSLCDQLFLIWELYNHILKLSGKSPSKGYLSAVNYRVLKVKLSSIIIFASRTLFPRFLHQVWLIRFSWEIVSLQAPPPAPLYCRRPLINLGTRTFFLSEKFHQLLSTN